MRYSGSDVDDQGPWFTVGKVDVTTTTLILGIWLVTLVIFAVEPPSLPVNGKLFLITDNVGFELWRYVTWPFAHVQFTLSEAIGAGFFWVFGTQIEREIGRRAFMTVMIGSLLIIPIVAVILTALTPWASGIADLRLFELVVVLLYIAERPTAQFFFGIPAWVIGAVIVALEVINDLHDRDWIQLLTVVVSAGLIALVARSVGMLAMYDKVPNLSFSMPRRGKAKLGETDRGAYSQPDPFGRDTKRKRSWGKKNNEPAEIVPMPTPQPRRRPSVATNVPDDVSVDDIALDLLLDKIADGGMDSLTADERQALDDLRARRRSK